MGKLYLVATPIGNLKDITYRAIEILKIVDIIACEDTRKTGLLLQKYGINHYRLLSYFEENELRRVPELVQLIKLGNNVALVSNSGTPTISDPGYKLVRACVDEGIAIESLPGPSALISALAISGLPTDKFIFLGFLPQKNEKKKKLFENYQQLNFEPAIIFYESPYRLIKSLQLMKKVYGDIDIIICREMTKLFEETNRGRISEIILRYQSTKPKGEFVILYNIRVNNENRNFKNQSPQTK